MSGATRAALTTIWMVRGTATNVVRGGIPDRSGYQTISRRRDQRGAGLRSDLYRMSGRPDHRTGDSDALDS
ncbi:MAG: hypothetical protein CMP98_09905 [Gammaproteobacteria bacterium]|nr:hypothetical protein [Gammaproteobacteria bacterium]OUU08313.1 MAG: hypothetical protein CBB94_10135 [Gammaproteobacteria bacterium TMED34]